MRPGPTRHTAGVGARAATRRAGACVCEPRGPPRTDVGYGGARYDLKKLKNSADDTASLERSNERRRHHTPQTKTTTAPLQGTYAQVYQGVVAYAQASAATANTPPAYKDKTAPAQPALPPTHTFSRRPSQPTHAHVTVRPRTVCTSRCHFFSLRPSMNGCLAHTFGVATSDVVHVGTWSSRHAHQPQQLASSAAEGTCQRGAAQGRRSAAEVGEGRRQQAARHR